MNVNRIVEEIKSGNLVIAPSDTTYGILADMKNLAAVRKVYKCKHRNQTKALIVLAGSIDMLRGYTQNISSLEEELIARYLPGRLTFLLQKNHKVSDIVTGGSDLVGIRIPDDFELIEIINKIGNPVISTSANISGKETITKPDEIETDSLEYISYIENSGEIHNEPSSIIVVRNGMIKILRDGEVARKIAADYKGIVDINYPSNHVE